MRELKLVEKYKGSLLLRFAVIVLAVFVVVSLIAQQRQIAEKREDLQTLQAQLATQNVKNEELQESLKDEEGLRDYAEKKAREELNYAKPGERVFVDAGASRNNTLDSMEPFRALAGPEGSFCRKGGPG